MTTKKWNDPIHPGEILKEELEYIGITAALLAEKIDVPKNRIYQIIKGLRNVTADTAIRLGMFFSQTPDFWMNLQKSYELDVAKEKIGNSMKIIPYQANKNELYHPSMSF
ncbi:MAG: HigA family addiction module antitoxin [Pseudomonadota bacterium]